MSASLEPTAVTGNQVPSVRAPRRRVRLLLLVLLVGMVVAGWFGGRYQWARQHLRAAERAVELHEFSEASREYERCLRIWPRDTAIRLQAARAARRAGNLERALVYLDACEASGVTTETAIERFMLRAQEGDLLEVELPLQRLIREKHPAATLVMEALARGYLRTHRLGFAHASLDDLLAHEPDHPEARFWRGTVLEDLDRLTEALPDYRRAVELAPRRVAYRLRLAQALLKYTRPGRAWPLFEELLRQAPADAAVLLAAARCLRAMNQPARAAEHLDALLEAHPENAEAWAERGLAAGDQGDDRKALRDLRRAFQLQPRSSAIGSALVAALRVQGHMAEADKVGNAVQRIKDQEERLGKLIAKLGKDRNAQLRHEIGLLLLEAGNEEQALPWLLGALQDNPNYRPTHEVLAEVYQRKGDTAAAAYHRQYAGR